MPLALRGLPQLGKLERAGLGRLWSHGPADVKAMQQAVGELRGLKPGPYLAEAKPK